MDAGISEELRRKRATEMGSGTVVGDAPLKMTLAYPSPYHVAMSSLGFLQIHRLANARPGTRCERAVLPEPEFFERHLRTRTPLATIESRRFAADAHLVGMSLSYELELTGVVRLFDLMGLEPFAKDRTADAPLFVMGGPITFSNPLPAAPFFDVVVLGEAEENLQILLECLEEQPEAARGDADARRRLLEDLAGQPGFFIPSLHGEEMGPIGQAPDAMLPAHSVIRTPDTELANMMLIEPERGCHRGCTFCVMRRSTNGGMRLVTPEKVLSLVPEDVPKVGLVGAAVTDHPGLKDILRELIDGRGKRIGISSLRADRLDAEIVGLMARGGYRSLTVAVDAASEAQRKLIEKNIRERHILGTAELARAAGMRHLKLYVIVGLPDETDDDLDELIALVNGLAAVLPVVLGVSPFVPKFRTPLADAPFAGKKQVTRALRRLERGLKGRAQIRGPGAREAFIEYRLAQGGFQHAEAAVAAARADASLADWTRALKDLPERIRPLSFDKWVPAPTRRQDDARRLQVLR